MVLVALRRVELTKFEEFHRPEPLINEGKQEQIKPCSLQSIWCLFYAVLYELNQLSGMNRFCQTRIEP